MYSQFQSTDKMKNIQMNKDYEKIAPYFSYPILEASIKLGVEMEDLRKICKENGLLRWPYSYKRKNETSKETAFLKFSLPERITVNAPKIFKQKLTKPCTLIAKIDVKNLLN